MTQPEIVHFTLTSEEAAQAGIDTSKKNYSNQLRAKLGLPEKKRESFSATLKEAKEKLGADNYKKVVAEALKKAYGG